MTKLSSKWHFRFSIIVQSNVPFDQHWTTYSHRHKYAKRTTWLHNWSLSSGFTSERHQLAEFHVIVFSEQPGAPFTNMNEHSEVDK